MRRRYLKIWGRETGLVEDKEGEVAGEEQVEEKKVVVMVAGEEEEVEGATNGG